MIKANEASFPDCAYYLPLFNKARRNATKHPDIAIELCKSALEGISKTIVLKLDDKITKAEVDKKDVDQIVKAAAKLLKQNDDVIEDNFVTRATSLTNALGALRNSRSDISHGREVPKPEYSTEKFARLCLQMTDAIATYLLEAYFHTSRPQSVATTVSTPSIAVAEAEGLEALRFENNEEFNDFLDQSHPLPGKLLYSAALFELYREDYALQLSAFEGDWFDEGDSE